MSILSLNTFQSHVELPSLERLGISTKRFLQITVVYMFYHMTLSFGFAEAGLRLVPVGTVRRRLILAAQRHDDSFGTS